MPIANNLRSARREERPLIRDQQPRDTRTSQRRNNTRNQRAKRDPTDIRTPTGRYLRQHADLVAEGPDIAEAAERIRGDEAGARGQRAELWVRLQVAVGYEFVLDDFGADEARDFDQVVAVARDAEEEGDGGSRRSRGLARGLGLSGRPLGRRC